MKTSRMIGCMALSSLLSGFAGAEPLKVGDPAPEVSAVTDAGERLALAEVYARQPYTLVYFFPKADTPGCTRQGCSLRDAYEQLTARGVTVIGVSTDNVEAQRAFREKFNFPFTLIADHDQTVIKAFGVPVKNIPIAGTFASRQAFLIKGGKIVWADYQASTEKQAADVLGVIAGLEK